MQTSVDVLQRPGRFLLIDRAKQLDDLGEDVEMTPVAHLGMKTGTDLNSQGQLLEPT